MICRTIPILYSAYIDGQASDHEQAALHRHLQQCSTCRREAAALRALRAELRALDAPESIPTLAGEIQIELRQEAAVRDTEAQRRAVWLSEWRTWFFSQSVGTVVSMCLFFIVMTGVFRPAYRTLALAQAATEVFFEDPSIRLKVLLLQPPPPPVFTPNGELLSAGASLSEEDEIIATVKVGKDGRASINNILLPSSDPSVMAKFSDGITQKASFQPARSNQNTSSDAVVILGKITVSARASI